MSHDTEEWSNKKLIFEKYAFFCVMQVSGRHSESAEKIYDNSLEWISFYY